MVAITRCNQYGRIVIGERVDVDNVDMLFYPSELIAMGWMMLGWELMQERRRVNRLEREEDVGYV